jgi:N-methylhydantoinase A/oxoprolinase/acetone carboxylase beta subunit
MNGDGWRIGVDIGGTFADCVGIAPDGTRRRIKILTDGRWQHALEIPRPPGRRTPSTP